MNNKIKSVIKKMTLDEKCAILTGGGGMSTLGIDRLKIPKKTLSDGPHGIRCDDPAVNNVYFPSLCNVGASWNRDVAYRVGQGIAKDCIEHDVQMILGPGINIKRNALCGRNFEYIAEDPVLAGELAAGYIRGCEDLGVATSLKHFAVNSQETNRTTITSEVDERTLREIYLRGFEIAVKKGNPASVMCAYNKINAIWCSENKKLLTDILKKEWGYLGLVVSDWGAVHDSAKVVNAGLDLQMPPKKDIVPVLTKALETGKTTMEAIDASVARVLEFAFRPVPEKLPFNRDDLHKTVQACAAEGITLLKNKDDVLPLCNGQKIAVVGEYALDMPGGGEGSGAVHAKKESFDVPLDCLKKNLPDSQVDYFAIGTNGYQRSLLWVELMGALGKTKEYDKVVLFLGNHYTLDTEKNDRYDAHLLGAQQLIITTCLNLNPNVVVVLTTGSVLFYNDWADRTKAIMQTWYGGEGAGQAVADVLTGKVNPSGKLPETFPMDMRRDIDAYGNGLRVLYTEGWKVGYRYYDLHPEEVWFPFGHGLSYTTFAYDNLAVNKTDDGYTVDFDLTNTGDRDGAEVVQIYVGDPVSTVSKPVKELKNFDKVFLKAGETKRLSLPLSMRDFAYYNVMLGDWAVEDGTYNIYVAASATDIKLKKSIVIKNPDCYTTTPVGTDMIGTAD